MHRKLGRSGLILITILAVVIATMAVAAVAAGAASGKPRTTTTLSISSKATLVPGGLNVTVSYTCFPAGYGGKGGYGGNFGDIRVTDLAGNQSFAFWSPICNDKKQTSVITVPGFFHPGAGAASVFACGFDCNGTSREIKIS